MRSFTAQRLERLIWFACSRQPGLEAHPLCESVHNLPVELQLINETHDTVYPRSSTSHKAEREPGKDAP